MKLKICLFILLCLQSNFIDAADQNAESSDLEFCFEPRSTQAELAEARKYKKSPSKVFTGISLVSPKLAEMQTAHKKNITKAVVNETSSNQNAQPSTLVIATLDSTKFSEKNPKSGVSQTLEAMRLKAKLPNTEINLAQEILVLLKERGETVAVAESLTGGMIAKNFTDFKGSSKAFKGGIIAYSIESKLYNLDVPKHIIQTHGVYSQETAVAMAEGVKNKFRSDWAIATTGVAGPGKSYGIDAGEVWISIIGSQVSENIKLSLTGDRASIRTEAVEAALVAFKRILKKLD